MKKRILIVDDDDSVRGLMRDLIGNPSHGLDVSTVSSAAEALAVVQNQSFDLMITDYNMPQMNGEELSRRLRELGYSFPIVMVTGSLLVEDQLEALSCGINVIVPKPFDPEALVDVVRNLVNGCDAPELSLSSRR